MQVQCCILSLLYRVINSSYIQLLTDGVRVRLWSFAYGMNLRIQQDGNIDGKGREGSYGK